MKPITLFCCFVFASILNASDIRENLQKIASASAGAVAFCKPSIIDELQIIGEPRRLSESESKELAEIFGNSTTYFDPKAKLMISHVFCLPHWDFKILLINAKDDSVISIRISSYCRQFTLAIDDKTIETPPIIRPEAMKMLTQKFDVWFPSWSIITTENIRLEEKRMIENSRLEKKRSADAVSASGTSLPTSKP